MNNIRFVLALLVATTSVNLLSQKAGFLDPAFGPNSQGFIHHKFNTSGNVVKGIQLLPDTSILITGYTYNASTGNDVFCAKLNTDGSFNTAFGTNGSFKIDLQTGSDDRANTIVTDDNGKIYIAGSSDNGNKQNVFVLRLKTDGTPDSTWGVNGIRINAFGSGTDDVINKIKIHTLTGKVVACGSRGYNSDEKDPIVARYTASGGIDSTFSNDGIFSAATRVFNTADALYEFNDLHVYPSGKVVMAGRCDYNPTNGIYDSYIYLARVAEDGTFDLSFDTDGWVEEKHGLDNNGMSIHVDATGKIFVGGYFTYKNTFNVATEAMCLVFFEADGSTPNLGRSYVYDDEIYEYCTAMARDNDGNFVLVGYSENILNTYADAMLVRAQNVNYFSDDDFGSYGFVYENFSKTKNFFYAVTVQPDNRILAAGYSDDNLVVARFYGNSVPQLDSFVLISPPNNATNQSPQSLTLRWSSAFGAKGYEIQTDFSPTFQSPTSYSAVDTQYTLTNLIFNTTYFWRVRATENGNKGAWKSPWAFTTGTNTVVNDLQIADVKMYPNPVRDFIYIDNENQAFKSWNLVSITGEKIATGNMDANMNKIATGKYAKGIYFIQMKDENGNSIQRKIVKE